MSTGEALMWLIVGLLTFCIGWIIGFIITNRPTGYYQCDLCGYRWKIE